MTAPRLWSRTACRRRGAGGAVYPQEIRRRISRKRDRLLPRRSGLGSRRDRPCRFLRQAVPEIRTADRNLSGFAPRGFRLSAWQCHCGSRTSYFKSGRLATSCEAAAPEFDWDRRLLFSEHHLSHAASAFFPSPFEERGHSDDGRRRRMGDDLGRDRRRQSRSRCSRRSISRTRSACCIRRSPIIPASGSTPANTRSWGSPLMASRDYAQIILDHLIDLKEDGSLSPRSRIFRLLHRADHDQRAFRPAVRRSGAKTGELLEQVHMDLAASIQASPKRSILRLTAVAGGRNRRAQFVPRRRRGAQLRRQRQSACATGASTMCGCSLRPAMPAARWARRSPPITSSSTARAISQTSSTACRAAISAPPSPR